MEPPFVSSPLPPTPDFGALEDRGVATSEQRKEIISHVGNLVFAWSNNESLFIYVLQILLRTDFPSAVVTFISLNTTRARLDLIRRLARLRLPDDEAVKRLDKLIERFNDCTRLRNEFNHCIYQVDAAGRITHTNVLRVKETPKGLEYVETRPFDAARIAEIERAVRRLTRLNRDLWAFLPVLQQAIRRAVETAKGPRKPSGGNS